MTDTETRVPAGPGEVLAWPGHVAAAVRAALRGDGLPGARTLGGVQTPRGRVFRGLFSGIWLLYLIQPAANIINSHHSPLYVSLAIATGVAFCAVYVAVVASWERRPVQAVLSLVALAALAFVATAAFHANGIWIFAAAVCGLTIRSPRLALRALGACTAGYVVSALISRDGTADLILTGLPVLIVGLAMIGFRRQAEMSRELLRARESVAQLAAAEERLRLARDMHDLTGQSLSLITLKSELAARLVGTLPPGPGRDRAHDQILEVTDVSRQALKDIREAISGYRRPTLVVEAITARGALEAAGIAVHDDSALATLSGTLDPDAEAVLAWCLREAVTNVARHSGAANCWVGLAWRGADLVLEVRDDGRGVCAAHAGDGAGPGCEEAGVVPAGSGHGLHGMSERLRAAGGTLEIRPSRGGFCLAASVPAGRARPAAEGATVAV